MSRGTPREARVGAEARVRAFLAHWGPPIPAEAGDATRPDSRGQCDAFLEAAPDVVCGRDEAFRWLERGFEERINSMVFLNSMESLDPLRDDPRFRDLVARIGLPN